MLAFDKREKSHGMQQYRGKKIQLKRNGPECMCVCERFQSRPVHQMHWKRWQNRHEYE